MRVLVCGPRDLPHNSGGYTMLHAFIQSLPEGSTVIHGAAKGADTMAGLIASNRDLEVKAYPANWANFHKAAGPLRNKQMLDEGQPDLVTAFLDRPLDQTKGTKSMVGLARKAGVRTMVVEVYGYDELGVKC